MKEFWLKLCFSKQVSVVMTPFVFIGMILSAIDNDPRFSVWCWILGICMGIWIASE